MENKDAIDLVLLYIGPSVSRGHQLFFFRKMFKLLVISFAIKLYTQLNIFQGKGYSESCQTSMLAFFAKKIKGSKLLTIFAKSSILDV